MKERLTAIMIRIASDIRIASRLCALACLLAISLPQAMPVMARGSSPASLGRGVQADFTDVTAEISLPRVIDVGAATSPRTHLSDPHLAAACTKLSAGKTAWFASDADGNVDTGLSVDAYDEGVTILAPGFKYACAPKDVDIVVIIYNESYGDQPALVDKHTLRASPGAGVFYYGLTTPDGQPLQNGQWRVAFYLGKTVLSTGEVVVGGKTSMDATQQAVLQGTIKDLRTGKPVAGARVFILNPGVTIADFTSDARNEAIYAQTRTDDQGQYALWKPLDRNTTYAMLIAADGYKLRGANNLTIGSDAETPVTLDVQIIKK